MQYFFEKMNEYGKKGEAFFFAVDFDLEEAFVLPPERAKEEGILFQIREKANFERPQGYRPPQDFFFQKSPPSFERYEKAFRHVQDRQKAGDSYLVNLTLPTAIETDVPLLDIFYGSLAPYKLYLNGRFVVFSPECFVQIREGKIMSFPMKGTIDASLPDAEAKILADEKEAAEHATIVDLIRNDLSRYAEKVMVKRYRYVEEIKTRHKDLLQVSSEICGELPDNYTAHIGDILASLLPAGSISGAPKKKTLEIIKQAEGYKRGFYTGVFGFFDGKNLDSAVMIRYIEQQKDGRLYFKSGGGITAYSKAAAEYQELADKVYLPVFA